MDDSSGTGGRRTGVIIANPAAGGFSEELVALLHERCRRHLWAVPLHRTAAAGEARQLVQAAVSGGSSPDLVIAVGGDGTVREVVEGLVTAHPEPGRPTRGSPTAPALLVVPAGTGNSNYLAHWGDLPWQMALDAALTGIGARLRRLDLARLVERDELVVLGAASGAVAAALAIARELTLTGRPRYQEAFSQACRGWPPYPGRVVVDGATVHEGKTVLANVGGARYRGGTYRMLPHSVLDDGLLDVCVVPDSVPSGDVPELVRTGAHLSSPGAVYARGRRVTIARTDGEPLWFEHDGELLAGTGASYTLTVLPGALPVLCRAAAAGDAG